MHVALYLFYEKPLYLNVRLGTHPVTFLLGYILLCSHVLYMPFNEMKCIDSLNADSMSMIFFKNEGNINITLKVELQWVMFRLIDSNIYRTNMLTICFGLICSC